MSLSPLVSVIIPAYQCDRFISDSIRSCLNQTYFPIEVIVVEDHGRDRTYAVASQFDDPRIRVYRNSENLGQHATKNRAVALSNGAFIKFCDGDDVLEPNCVAIMMRALQRGGATAGMAVCRSMQIDEEGRRVGISRRHGLAGMVNGRRLLDVYYLQRRAGSFFGNPTAVLLRREAFDAVGGMPSDRSWSGDLETFLRVAMRTDVVFVPEALVRYRLQSQSVTQTTSIKQGIEDNFRLVERVCEDLEKVYGNDAGDLIDAEADWAIWVNRAFIFAHWYRRLIGRSHQFDTIRDVYASRNMDGALDKYIRREALSFISASFGRRLRRALGLPEFPPVFGARERALLKRAPDQRL